MRRRHVTMKRTAPIAATAALVSIALCACSGGSRPHRAMTKAAASEESVPSQAQDHAIRAQVRERLLEDGLGVAITPYVYMGRVYLVGFVTSAERRDVAIHAAQDVSGVRSVQAYVPTILRSSSEAEDRALEAEIKARLAVEGQVASRIDVAVVGGHAVLMGVLPTDADIASAVATAKAVGGVSGVTSFLHSLPTGGRTSRNAFP